METFAVSVEPVDPLLFGDNRSARAGEDHWRSDQDPLPATFYGALGARVAAVAGVHGQRDWSKVAGTLGPFSPEPDAAQGAESRSQLLGFTLRDAEGRLWFPQPAHLRIDRKGHLGAGYVAHDLLRPARPEEASFLSSLPEGQRPLAAGKEPPPGDESEVDWRVSPSLLGEVLAGGDGLAGGVITGELREPGEIYRGEGRLGLAVENARNTAREGHLFSRPYRRFRCALGSSPERPWRGAGYTAWYRVPRAGGGVPGEWDGLGFLGGDRRRVSLGFTPLEGEGGRPLPELCQRVAAAAEGDTRGYLAYLLTPALAEAGGIEIGGRRPIASAAGRAYHASGWFRARDEQGPRPLVTLLPAGSVYFFEWGDLAPGPARRQWIERHWLETVSPRTPCTGLGRALLGVW